MTLLDFGFVAAESDLGGLCGYCFKWLPFEVGLKQWEGTGFWMYDL
ncbi:hypothetical protein IFO70_03810 [Phormidium tenue FACHB-886]|nr:hypothetical protein [Phormidium tenue FACHB-886]